MQNDYYGSNYASFPLKQFLQWTQNESATPRSFTSDDESDASAAPPLAPAAVVPGERDVPLTSSLQCTLLASGFQDAATEEALVAQSSAFSIDINPRLVLSSEALVETLITSGVGQYLEFTAVQHTYVHLPNTAVLNTDPLNTVPQDTVWSVPCSKKDVFQSTLLSMVEKRQLMKFLQFVADYGETHIVGEDVETKNERSLALGRALKRPQNKVNQATAVDDVATYLDAPFQALLETHFKLSPKLQQVVVYCVGLASFPAAKNQISGRDGLAAVYRYVASIGRFTSTAFLVPLYGVSEIAQSFCRLCAVYGGIYVLRAPITAFIVRDDDNKDAGAATVSDGPAPATPSTMTTKSRVVGIRTTDGGVLRAKQFIVNGSYVDSFKPTEALQGRRTHGQILRGVFLLTTSLRRDMARLLIVVPPEDAALKNPFAIQVVQLDSGACVCPRGYYLVHLSMPLPHDWLNDATRQLALVNGVMAQLLTSARAEHGAGKRATAKTTPLSTGVSSPDNSREQEMEQPSAPPSWEDAVAWRVVYTMDHLASSTSTTTSLAHRAAASHLPVNVWPCETRIDTDAEATKHEAMPVNPLEIHLESASANARAIFDQLCPDDAFLPKSASAEQAEKDALDDEHGAVLQAAQKLAADARLDGHDSTEGVAADATDLATDSAQTEEVTTTASGDDTASPSTDMSNATDSQA